jgi:hypothetical protein
VDAGRNHAAWLRYSLHLCDHLFYLGNDIQGECGNGRIEGVICKAQLADITAFVGDVRVRATAAGPFQIPFGGIHTSRMYAGVGERFCQNASATAHIEGTSARGDTGESQERLRQEFTPPSHKNLIRIRIGPVR